jgi:hypothetical protein
MALIEVFYYLTNKPYFLVYVLSNGRKIKKFVQLASGNGKGETFFLVDKSLKAGWFKPEYPIIDGLKFLTFVDLKNAIPLIITDITVNDSGEFFNREINKSVIEIDRTKPMKSGKPIKTVEICYPPTLLHQEVEAHFVNEIQKLPPNPWEEKKWIFIVAILALAFIAWQFMQSGALQNLGG